MRNSLDRLRERDREHLIYEPPKQGSGASRTQRLTPLELFDRLDALVAPPRLHRYSACWRERPLTGNFRGDTERPVMAVMHSL